MKRKMTKYTLAKSEPMMLQEMAIAPGIGENADIALYRAKAEGRGTFQGMGDFLLRQPVHGGPSAEELIREDRDARGW